MDKIICIVGPTASGKTRLSIALAQALGAEVVSFDSMQLYRGMDIGTAKPTKEEMQGIPHHMLDFLDPREDYSVSRYVQDADRCVQDIFARGKPVILVGGTGLYIDSLILGRQFAPYPETGRREALTRQAQEQGIETVLAQLREVDPEAAAALHPSNQKRIIRALEVYQETGKTITEHNRLSKLRPPKYHPLWLGLTFSRRQTLYDRIDRRVEEMLRAGLVDEVRRLVESGVSEKATALQAIGYKELLGMLRGECTLEEAKASIQLLSRRYAKRQLTWFRRNPDVHWIEAEAPWEEIFLTARQYVTAFDSTF